MLHTPFSFIALSFNKYIIFLLHQDPVSRDTYQSFEQLFLWGDIFICVLSIVHRVDIKFSVLTVKTPRNKTKPTTPRSTRNPLEVTLITMIVIIHKCVHMFKRTKLYTLNMCSFWYNHYTSKKLLKIFLPLFLL